MEYISFAGNKVSRLGFGTMRLPVLDNDTMKIDAEHFQRMTDTAISQGINFFDTAVPYHCGRAENFLGDALSKYPRESYFLSDKFPAHQVMPDYSPAPIFEKQLAKCKTDYFDYYLMHNVYENSFSTYTDEKWGIIDYFIQQKKLGRIKHLGLSSHARPDTLEMILDRFGDEFEFCLIQLNYLDWSMQDAKKKYDLLTKRGLEIMVMEPLRGGKLVKADDKTLSAMKELHPDSTPAEWAFNWLRNLPNVKVVLSGMSDEEQMKQNISTFSKPSFVGEKETELLFTAAEGMKNSLPCTSCRYCCEGCPMGLDIPVLINAYNDCRFADNMTIVMQMDALPEGKRPSDCIGCGACEHICPQKIKIPEALSEFAEKLAISPKWKDICAARETVTDYR